MTRKDLTQALFDAFPPQVFRGNAAPHQCDECSSLSSELSEKSWPLLTYEFVEENSDVLPLLSIDAYFAFLPAWLLQAIEHPNSDGADMLMISLKDFVNTERFSEEQRRIIVAVADWVCEQNTFGPEDPVNVERKQLVRKVWGKNAI